MNVKLYITNKYLNHFKRVLSIRRISIDTNVTLEMFMDTLNKNVLNCNELYKQYCIHLIQYVDEENDWIDVTNQGEWDETQQLGQNMKMVRVKVVLKTVEKIVPKNGEHKKEEDPSVHTQRKKILQELMQFHRQKNAPQKQQHVSPMKHAFPTLFNGIKTHPHVHMRKPVKTDKKRGDLLQDIRKMAQQMEMKRIATQNEECEQQKKWECVHRELKNIVPKKHETQQLEETPETKETETFKEELDSLDSMGFENKTLNRKLLNHYKGDMTVVINTLLKL